MESMKKRGVKTRYRSGKSIIPRYFLISVFMPYTAVYILVEAGADNPEPVRRQGSPVQLDGQILPVPLIFLLRYLLHGGLYTS